MTFQGGMGYYMLNVVFSLEHRRIPGKIFLRKPDKSQMCDFFIIWKLVREHPATRVSVVS